MEIILVSACLLGENCKYNGGNNYHEKIELLKKKYDIVPICPEVLGGLSTPRSPSEIKNYRVINKEGLDVTKNFMLGRDKVINIVKYAKVKKAILKENSPSCGVNHIYDGKFNHTLINGEGITTSALRKLGVEIYSENDIEELLK